MDKTAYEGLTAAQKTALHDTYRAWKMNPDVASPPKSFDDFVRDKCSFLLGDATCVMVDRDGLFIGVEADGYRHT